MEKQLGIKKGLFGKTPMERSQETNDLLKNLPSEEQIFNETKEMFHKMTDEQLRLATFDLWWKLHHLTMEVMELRVNSKSWWQKWHEVRRYDKERQKLKKWRRYG